MNRIQNKEDKTQIIDNFFIMVIVQNLQKDKIILVKKEVPENYLKLNNISLDVKSIWIFPSDFPKLEENRQISSERIAYEQTGYKVRFIEPIKESLITMPLDSTREFFNSISICEVLDEKINPDWEKPDYIEEIMWVRRDQIHKYILDEIRNNWKTKVRYAIGDLK